MSVSYVGNDDPTEPGTYPLYTKLPPKPTSFDETLIVPPAQRHKHRRPTSSVVVYRLGIAAIIGILVVGIVILIMGPPSVPRSSGPRQEFLVSLHDKGVNVTGRDVTALTDVDRICASDPSEADTPEVQSVIGITLDLSTSDSAKFTELARTYCGNRA